MKSRLETVLFFNRAYPPSDQATAILLHQLVEELRGRFDVQVASEPMSILTPYRLLSYAIYAVAAIVRALATRTTTLAVIWSDPPMLNCILGSIFRMRKIPYVLVVQDLYPEILFRTQIFKRSGFIGSVLANIQRTTLAQAERVVAISPDMEEVLHRDYGLGRKQSKVIQNWSPISLPPVAIPTRSSASASSQPTPRDKAGVKKPFVVKYSGNLGIGFDCNMVVDIARTLNHHNIIQLVVQGSGRYLWRIDELAKQYPCVKIVNRVDASRVADSLLEADAFLLPTPAHLAGSLFPSKIYAYAALGRPVIVSAPASSYLHELVGRHGLGLTAPSHSPESVVEKMVTLATMKAEDPDRYLSLCSNGINYTRNVWNRLLASQKYAELLLEIGVIATKGSILHPDRFKPKTESTTPEETVDSSSDDMDDIRKSS